MRWILMLHGVDHSDSVLTLSPRQLESLLRALLDAGLPIVPLPHLLASPDHQGVALTFDDGFASVHSAAWPVLRAFGVSATLFVTTGYVGRDNRWPSQPADAPTQPILTWDALEELRTGGWDLQAHSVTHPDLRTLSDDQLAEELEQPREELQRRLGIVPDTLAYPYGYFDARVVAAARPHYAHAVTTVFRPTRPEDDPLLLPRLDAYYLRSPLVHSWIGNNPPFRALLELRGALRRLRRHPGELSL